MCAINGWGRGVALFELGKIFRGSASADNSVGSVREGRLVDDRIEDRRFDALLLAPVLRENVMDIDVFAKEDRVIELLAGTKILRAFFHEKRVHAFVSSC